MDLKKITPHLITVGLVFLGLFVYDYYKTWKAKQTTV
jgi:hypothetical protein